MKGITLLILAAAAAATANPFNSSQESDSIGWFVPQLDGTFEWMTEQDVQNFARQKVPTGRAAAEAGFYLYTRNNQYTPQPLVVNDATALRNSNFNKANPTAIIIHGWQNSYLSDVNVILRNALLGKKEYNVIGVDWGDEEETYNYPASASRVPGVGKQVASFIDFLYKDGGMNFKDLLVVGHSLGAHVAGFAGKNVKYGQIAQITGLDPALPLYSYDKPAERLHYNDAAYVESIQTCGALLGFLLPIGKGAFYPNGGKTQPGCGVDFTGSCAHSRAYIYYAEAISRNNFPSMKCGTYDKAVERSCGSKYSSVKMGAATNHNNAFGYFYVPVNRQSPYGKGS